jgi:putative acetyltransferase
MTTELSIAGLAPLAVMPEMQSKGVGSALVRAGLRECATIGWQAIFLLGNPVYYSRFGFSLAAEQGLRYESEAFDASFQMIELVPRVLSGCRGWVRYHEAFSNL